MTTRRAIQNSNARIVKSLEQCPAGEEFVQALLESDDMLSLFSHHIEANPELASLALQAGIGTLVNAMRIEGLGHLERQKAGMN